MPLSYPRAPRAPRTERLRARRSPVRRFRPEAAGLEGRLLLSTATLSMGPTDGEQYMLALINQVRANPAAAGQQLYQLAQTDPVIKQATQGEDLNAFLAEIDSFGPEPPLAFNTNLIAAATAHSQAMLAANSQYHSPSNYLTDPTQGVNGQAYYPTGNNSWATGENIFAYSANVSGDVTDYVKYFEEGFLLDWGNPDFGHMTNLLAPGPGEWTAGSSSHYPYSEIGLGLLENVTPTVAPPSSSQYAGNQGLNVGPDIITQEFGWRSGNPILTGEFYLDKGKTGFYAPGEGYGGVTITAVGTGGQGTFSTTTWSTGGYSLQLPSGTYNVTATGGGLPSAVSTKVTLGTDNVEWDDAVNPTAVAVTPVNADQPVPGNYAGNATTQLGLYRSSTGQWFIGGQSQPTSFGEAGVDIPVPGNYGGAATEIAVYRPTTSQWFVLTPTGGKSLGVFGSPTLDIPMPGNYDNVGHDEVAVYRPSTAQWFVQGPTGNHLLTTFGAANTDMPEPGDYDGVGYTEAAVYRPSTGQWFVHSPTGNKVFATLGQPGDIPEPGDYDGVGHVEAAVYRPSTAQWLVLGPNGVHTLSFGWAGVDVPVHGDFDGDGKDDIAVYRPTTGQWFMRDSTAGGQTVQFGLAGASTPITSWMAAYAQHPNAQVALSLLTTPTAPTSTTASPVSTSGVVAQAVSQPAVIATAPVVTVTVTPTPTVPMTAKAIKAAKLAAAKAAAVAKLAAAKAAAAARLAAARARRGQ